MATIAGLRAQLDDRNGQGLVAVVGAAVRGPAGVSSVDRLWSAVQNREDLTCELPSGRVGTMGDTWALADVPSRAGYVDDPFAFDADFFRISPREARAMDPQHRWLLELTWEAFENAGIRPADCAAATGVFVGITGQDHRWRAENDPTAHWTAGNGHSFAAGRIAYAFDLRGPAVAMDTACSSSLSAVHAARSALLAGDCEVAIVAGVNLVLSGRSTMEIARTGALSPNGSCRPFDARANGFVRGEGCAAVVLKRLSDATAAGDRVLGVIRASGLNQDGASSGFTAPNVRAQVDLLERVLRKAGVQAADVGYIETHGTGTPLGDPIEMAALVDVIGRPSRDRVHHVGSIKSNFGHLEAAAGLFGMVRALEALRRRTVPPQAGFTTLNPRIDLDGTSLSIPTEEVQWGVELGRCALVSSFGMSGTNACVVLERHDAPTAADDPPSESVAALDIAPPVLYVSAAGVDALRELAAQYADALAMLDSHDFADFADFANATVTDRTRLAMTIAVTAHNLADAESALRSLAAGEHDDRCGPLPPDEPPPMVATPRRIVTLPTYPWQHRSYVTSPGRDSVAADG